ncbi:hypothetical protein F383_34883 [Gossypium arboreum]|uniref:Uncharacterized protein n=1 Tax=Gossypium arboreum TaxID=29729 RepID=A0A0B0N9Q2_GOSAR|nr:hypothetical protein F383_34883 [Gossypium arboreum]
MVNVGRGSCYKRGGVQQLFSFLLKS